MLAALAMRSLALCTLVALCAGEPHTLNQEEAAAARRLLDAVALRRVWLWRRPFAYARPFPPGLAAADPGDYVAALNEATQAIVPPIMLLDDRGAVLPAAGVTGVMDAAGRPVLAHLPFENGVVRIRPAGLPTEGAAPPEVLSGLPNYATWRRDLAELKSIARDPEVRSLAQDRLHVLEDNFHLHRRNTVHEARREMLAAHAARRDVPMRGDRRNRRRRLVRGPPAPPPGADRVGYLRGVTRVDTHVHLAAAFTASEIVDFMREVLRANDPHDLVDGRRTLAELLRDEGLPHEHGELTEAALTLAAEATFERFDRFDDLYKPAGSAALRTLLLKHVNGQERFNPVTGAHTPTPGRYYAELLRRHLARLPPHVVKEMRISVKGADPTEWAVLADWVVRERLFDARLRWVVQVPRNYREFREDKLKSARAALLRGDEQMTEDEARRRIPDDQPLFSYEELLRNVFEPMVWASAEPARHANLHRFLAAVVALDSVSDESRPDECDAASARDLDAPGVSPAYPFELFHLAANLAAVNAFREQRGLSTIAFRPHAGEAGDAVGHLAAAFLTAEAIGHGIALRSVPALQYLFYLARVPLALTPISNNRLFLRLGDSPVGAFFRRGLVVSLGTDDPAFLALTDDALMEEYANAAHHWRLSYVDLVEIARNSVLASGLEAPVKARLVGAQPAGARTFAGPVDPASGVPPARIRFRAEMFEGEWATITQQPLTQREERAGQLLQAAHGEAAREPPLQHS